MQGQKGKCKDKKENARTTKKAIPWIAASKSSDQKSRQGPGLGGLASRGGPEDNFKNSKTILYSIFNEEIDICSIYFLVLTC